MSTKLLFVCDLCGVNSITNTIYGMWLAPIVILFNETTNNDVDRHICECCVKGIAKEFKNKIHR